MGSVLLLSVALALGADADETRTDLPEHELAARASAEVAAGLRERDNEVQARPHFRRAAGYYEALQSRGVHNAVLFRDLGNAYFLSADIPNAMLAYRRGLRLRPADADLRTALASARERVYVPADGTLGRPPEEDASSWLLACPPAWLVALAASLYLCACLAATRWWMTRSRLLLSFAILLMLSATATIFLVRHQVNRAREDRLHPLIVVRAAQVQLLQGNGPDYPPRYATPARPGVEGRLLFERDGWLQIELASGEIGWVSASQVIVDRE